MRITNKKILWACMQGLLYRPYKWGGDDPMGGFDCSGGIQELLASIGIDPKGDQTAQALYNHFDLEIDNHWIGDSYASIYRSFGHLLFFGKGNDKITHVSMAINHRSMFEFAGGGSKTNTIDDAIRHNAYARIRAIDSRKDFISAIGILGG
jgi:cell wall-associated NlpC family hydrolase